MRTPYKRGDRLHHDDVNYLLERAEEILANPLLGPNTFICENNTGETVTDSTVFFLESFEVGGVSKVTFMDNGTPFQAVIGVLQDFTGQFHCRPIVNVPRLIKAPGTTVNSRYAISNSGSLTSDNSGGLLVLSAPDDVDYVWATYSRESQSIISFAQAPEGGLPGRQGGVLGEAVTCDVLIEAPTNGDNYVEGELVKNGETVKIKNYGSAAVASEGDRLIQHDGVKIVGYDCANQGDPNNFKTLEGV